MAARVQLPLDGDSPAITPVPLAEVPELSYRRGDSHITVTGGGFEVVIDKSTGLITSYEAAGTELLVSGPAPNFWRAPTDNDHGNGNGQHTRTRSGETRVYGARRAT